MIANNFSICKHSQKKKNIYIYIDRRKSTLLFIDSILEKGYLETSNYVHGREVPFYFLVRSTEQIYALARIATSERRSIRKISRVTDWNARRYRFYDLNLRVCETIDSSRMLLVDRFERRSEARIYPSKRGSSNSSDLVKSLTFPLFLDYNRNFRLVRSMAESHRETDGGDGDGGGGGGCKRNGKAGRNVFTSYEIPKIFCLIGRLAEKLEWPSTVKIKWNTLSLRAFSLIHVNVLDVGETKVSQWRNENTFQDSLKITCRLYYFQNKF
ncbi:hypothetical protein V1478_018840 [Vespula squamosa]|uniref:Maturase K n=1 Tax=Vespula squamosa TaxID=30214 RepID=A0ABD1ZTZ2_VESSQ